MILLFLPLLSHIPQSFGYRFLPEEDTHSNTYSENGNHGQKYVIKSTDRPYHVLVFYGTLYCSGSLITSRFVITTASCFMLRDKEPAFVKLGANFIQGLGQMLKVEEIKIHEFFGRLSEIDNDIALVVLEDHVDFRQGMQKVLIVDPDTVLRMGTTIEASGWASQSVAAPYVHKLILSPMRVIDKRKCRELHENLITNSNFCASYAAERRLSDNGGPVMFKDLLVGLISYGANFREPPNYALITNVSYFNRWITLNINELLGKYCERGFETVESFEEY